MNYRQRSLYERKRINEEVGLSLRATPEERLSHLEYLQEMYIDAARQAGREPDPRGIEECVIKNAAGILLRKRRELVLK